MKINQLLNDVDIDPVCVTPMRLPLVHMVDAIGLSFHWPMPTTVQSYPSKFLSNTSFKRFGCPHCSERFSRNSDAKRHIRTIHSDQSVKCETCEKVFKRKDTYLKHARRFHSNS